MIKTLSDGISNSDGLNRRRLLHVLQKKSPLQGGERSTHTTVVPGTRKQHIQIDNSWVVPHSPELIRRFPGQFIAESCISRIGSIKYLFKYVCKGPDRVTVEIRSRRSKDDPTGPVREVPTIDEILAYQDARYISASEATWRLFSFPTVEHHPTTERLEVHLKGNHKAYFEKGNEAGAALKSESKPTKLLGWFATNKRFVNTAFIPYNDFPKYFTFNKTDRAKYKAKNSRKVLYDFALPPHGVVGRICDKQRQVKVVRIGEFTFGLYF